MMLKSKALCSLSLGYLKHDAVSVSVTQSIDAVSVSVTQSIDAVSM